MAKPPAIQFYVRDWTTDCNGLSVAAKGAWIQMICQLHLATKRGELTKTPGAWARICGCTAEELDVILQELNDEETARVTFCNGRVTVVSRRFERERKQREQEALRQRRHRAKEACHENVTTPSASAVSATASAPAKKKKDTPPKPPKKVSQREQEAQDIAAEYKALVNNPGDTTCTASGRGPKNIAKLLKDHDAKDLRQAAVNYAESCTILEKEPTYRMFCGNFYGRDATYLAFMPGEYVTPVQTSPLDAEIAKAHAAGKKAREEMDNA